MRKVTQVPWSSCCTGTNRAYRLLQVLDEDTDDQRVALALLCPGGAGLLCRGPDGVVDGFFFGAVRLGPHRVVGEALGHLVLAGGRAARHGCPASVRRGRRNTTGAWENCTQKPQGLMETDVSGSRCCTCCVTAGRAAEREAQASRGRENTAHLPPPSGCPQSLDLKAAMAGTGTRRLWAPRWAPPQAHGALTSRGHDHSLQGSTKGPQGQSEAFQGKKRRSLLFFFEGRAAGEEETQAAGQNS